MTDGRTTQDEIDLDVLDELIRDAEASIATMKVRRRKLKERGETTFQVLFLKTGKAAVSKLRTFVRGLPQ